MKEKWIERPFIEYLNAVDELFERRYGCTTTDADIAELASAQEDGWRPREYVVHMGRARGLKEIGSTLCPF